jgi:hypothetical protein
MRHAPARSCLIAAASALALSAAAAPSPRSHGPHPATPSLAKDADPRTTSHVTPQAYSGPPVSVLTYHYDNGRSGWNPTETDLTPASVASASFKQLAVLTVDGNVFAQPLVVTGYKLPDGSVHDVLIIATGHNTVYAFDAQTYAILWTKNLGTAQSSGDVGCYDVVPEYGISSTPVIRMVKGGRAEIFVVSATEPSPGSFRSDLNVLDLGTGNLLASTQINPTATLSDGSTVSFDPQNQWSRAGLAAAGESIYVSIGSHCDNNSGSITGWELNYNETTLALQGAFHTIETPGGTELASIWMTGFAPAIDRYGNVFVVTGNGDFTKGERDWGESVLKLNGKLTSVLGKFTPSDYNSLNDGDTDFGSGGVMLLPTVAGQSVPPLAVAIGKSSILYLMNQNHLGGLTPNDSGALQSQYVGGGGLWGGPAFYNGLNGPMVFTQTGGDVLRGLALSTTGTASLTPTLAGTTSAGYGGTTPVVSSNGSAGGVVWVVRRSNPISFEAYDASKLGQPLFTQNIGTWSNQNNQNPFVAPVEANGRIYAPAYLKVTVFGLAQ